MFEVECPDCRHTFDVDDDEQTARCPVCTLELDLLEPGESPPDDALEPEEPFEEVPCPHCGGPLLVAASDESGLCAHCERPLIFQDQKALPFPEAPGTGQEPGIAEDAPVSNGGPASGFFDPALEVTPENAPLVECAPVASRQPDAPMEPVVQREVGKQSPNEVAGKSKGSGGKRSRSKKTLGKTTPKSSRKAASKKSTQGKPAKKAKKAKKRSGGGKRSSSSSRSAGKRAKREAKKTRGGRN